MHPSTGSIKFKELISDFFLHQVHVYPTRLNHILDLVLTSAPEHISNFSTISPSTMSIFTDHHLMFFDLQLHVKSTALGTMKELQLFNFPEADWNALYEALGDLVLIQSESNDIDTFHERISKDATLPCGLMARLNIYFKRRTLAEERPNASRAPTSGKSIGKCDEKQSPSSMQSGRNSLNLYRPYWIRAQRSSGQLSSPFVSTRTYQTKLLGLNLTV